MQDISSKDFFEDTPYNQETKNQIWMSQIADSHDNICNCHHPFAHLLASIFPPGHKDRDLTINQILLRDYTQKCLSGGEGDERGGLAEGTSGGDAKNIKEDPEKPTGEEDIDQLLAAAAAAAEDTR